MGEMFLFLVGHLKTNRLDESSRDFHLSSWVAPGQDHLKFKVSHKAPFDSRCFGGQNIPTMEIV